MCLPDEGREKTGKSWLMKASRTECKQKKLDISFLNDLIVKGLRYLVGPIAEKRWQKSL